MGRFIPPFTPKTFPDAVNPFTRVKSAMTASEPSSELETLVRADVVSPAPSEFGGSNPLVNAWLVLDNKDLKERYTSDGELDRIQLSYLEPGSFTVQKSANYATVQILGRSEPVRGYAHSSARVISLQIMVPPMTVQPNFKSSDSMMTRHGVSKIAGALGGIAPAMSSALSAFSSRDNAPTRKQGGVSQSQRDQIFLDKKTLLHFLQSLVYPYYNPASRIIMPPPPVLLIFGEFMWLRGVVTNVTMKHSPPYDPKTATPYFTEVNLTIEEANRPYSFRDAYTGKSDKIY